MPDLRPSAPAEQSPPTLPAAASIAVSDLLVGQAVQARVLGAFDAAVYMAVTDAQAFPPPVVALVASDGVALPNALIVNRPAASRPFADARGATARIGGGTVEVGGLVVGAARWWDPRPRLPQVARDVLRRRATALEATEAGAEQPFDIADATAELADATLALDGGRTAVAARSLVGAGTGLTPAGDDVLAALLATLRLLPTALPPAAWQLLVADVADHLSDEVLQLGPRRTTALSAALLWHATRGEVAGPAARLLLALAGHGDVPGSARRLCDVGHTSGRDLLAGIRAGTAAVLRAASGSRRG